MILDFKYLKRSFKSSKLGDKMVEILMVFIFVFRVTKMLLKLMKTTMMKGMMMTKLLLSRKMTTRGTLMMMRVKGRMRMEKRDKRVGMMRVMLSMLKKKMRKLMTNRYRILTFI